jgi:hypothetical protein
MIELIGKKTVGYLILGRPLGRFRRVGPNKRQAVPLSVEDSDMPEELTRKDKMSFYEDGKHRRYSLLFSVNGGAFAVAKILIGVGGTCTQVLGQLTLPELSWGLILFTAVMVGDIYAFGDKFRSKLQLSTAFDWRGKLVLISIGLIISFGWFLVGRSSTP